jgi:hypothetical protein
MTTPDRPFASLSTVGASQFVLAEVDSTTTARRPNEQAIDLDWKCVLAGISRRGSQMAIPNS